MKKITNVSHALFVTLILFSLIVPTESSAQVVQPCIATSTFDTAATGTVAGKEGWSVINTSLDQAVVENLFGFPTFGCKSLRMSNASTSNIIWTQVFSPATNDTGESTALNGSNATGTTRNRFEAQFDLASVMPTEQPGMHMSVSPNRGPNPGDGTRMSSLSFADSAAGIDVYFDDVTGTSSVTTFNNTQIASGLSRTTPHTFKFLIDFVEGPSNDIVKIFIDNNPNPVHTGTSWENFYRFDAGANGGPTPDASRTVNSLSFYEPNFPPFVVATPANLSKGYLIDNVSLSSTSTTSGTTTPPATNPAVITLLGSNPMSVTQNTTFVDPGATAVSGTTTVQVTATGTVDIATLGTYIITYSATGTDNSVATTTRTVNVVAAPVATSTLPVITLTGSSTMSIFINSVFADPGATAVSGTTTVPVTATGTVDTSILGTYTILYTATGTNNDVATTTRTVIVVSTSTPPTITLNGSSTMNVTINTAFTDPGATAVNAIGVSVPVTATGTVNTAALGNYVITYTATDTNNNTATTTRTVSVVSAPVVPPPAVATSGGGGGGGGLFYPPVPGMPAGFVFAPLPGQIITSTTGSTVSPVTVGTVGTPTGQVLGATIFNFTRNLRFGSRGLDVMELQKILIASGDLVLGTPTQYFGTLTRAALRRWQARHGIIATGFFGPLSRAAVLRQ